MLVKDASTSSVNLSNILPFLLLCSAHTHTTTKKYENNQNEKKTNANFLFSYFDLLDWKIQYNTQPVIVKYMMKNRNNQNEITERQALDIYFLILAKISVYNVFHRIRQAKFA